MDVLLPPSGRASISGPFSRLRSAIPTHIERDYIIGLVLLSVVVFLWTSSNFVTQAIFQDGFEKPFLVTYLNTSAFTLYLLPFLSKRRRQNQARNWNTISEDRVHLPQDHDYQPVAAGPRSEFGALNGVEEEGALYALATSHLAPLTIRETRNLALIFCLLWFIANWSVNASLNYTSVASATILSSMSGLFTLAIGRLFLVETLTLTKILAVVVSFVGVILVSLSDQSAPAQPTPQTLLDDRAPHPILGDFLALISAVFYALYVILLKVRIREESRVDMQLFFGFVGLFNILTCWVIGVILHVSGIEPFELPSTQTAVIAIIINMFITLTSDYLYVLAMLKTTPLVVTVGLSLTIPLAVVGDLMLGRSTRGQVLVGAFLVLLSFVVVGIDDANVRLKKEEAVPMDSE